MPEPVVISNLDTKDIIFIAGAAGAIIAACVSATFLMLNGWRQRIDDAKRHRVDSQATTERHFRELAIQAALAHWSMQVDFRHKWNALTASEQNETKPPHLDDIDLFLVEKLVLFQQFGRGDLTPDALEEGINRFSEISHNLRKKRRGVNKS